MERLVYVSSRHAVVVGNRGKGLACLRARPNGRQRCSAIDKQRIAAGHGWTHTEQRSLRRRNDEFRRPLVSEGDAGEILLNHLMKDSLPGTDFGEGQQSELQVTLSPCVVVEDVGAVAEHQAR